MNSEKHLNFQKKKKRQGTLTQRERENSERNPRIEELWREKNDGCEVHGLVYRFSNANCSR